MLYHIRVWAILLTRAVRYFAYRMGVGSTPTLMDVRNEIMQGFVDVFGWRKRLRVLNSHWCPQENPAIFAGNHMSGLDPFIMYRAVFLSTQGKVLARFMMREGVFPQGSFFKSRLLDLDEISNMAGTFHISREHAQLSQLKPFIKLLRENESFIIFPGRTRTRSGLFVEYREGIEEPGSVSFFIVQARRGRPELRIPAVPLVRTINPVTKGSALVFGEPVFLVDDADRAAQRDFDYTFITSLGSLVELNAAHIVSLLLYLRCLHGLPDAVPLTQLTDDVSTVIRAVRHRQIDPALLDDARRQVERTVGWLAKHEMIRRDGADVVARRDALLTALPPDREYRKKNPVKYLVNQILHLSDVIAAAERAVLRD